MRRLYPSYQFYPCAKSCPACGAGLLTAIPLTRTFTQGPLERLGITCYCVSCNRRYRATSPIRFVWVAWLGPVGRWLWWKATSLELTLKPEEEPGG